MKKLIITIILVGLASAAFAQVEVQNAVAAPGSGRVTISYDLVATVPCKITVIVSNDGGSSYGIYPTALSGDVGDQIAPGSGKEIIWTPAADTMAEGESYRIKIIARENPVQDDEHFASFVRVEGGPFHNGTSDVMLSSFYMDKYEITQAEYQAVMGTNPSSFSGTPNRPVEWVTWFNAIEYCNRRSMQEGFTPCYSYSTFGTDPDDWPSGWDTAWQNHINVSCDWSADGYRLPTEMEWMFAAMGGNQSLSYTYSGSDTITDVAWYRNNSYDLGSDHPDYGTHNVGTKALNEIGACDMSGNISEWVWDIHGDYPSGSQTNPTGASSGNSRVQRGGSWISYNSECTVSYRSYLYALGKANSRGFRCVRSIPAVSPPTFDPLAGIYSTAQSVVITCATEGAAIYYSTDGSEPDESSSLYSGAIAISSTTTLKARAYKAGFVASAIAEAEYVIIEPQSVLVPGGTFTMGNTLGGGNVNEHPPHSVTLSSFYMGKYEVTQLEWMAIMGTNPASGYGVGDTYPVYYVSRYDILKYCNLRSMAEGLTPVYSISGSTDPADWGSVPTTSNSTWDAAICNWNANGYRLPTEAEWEYAARGASNNPDYLYSGSDDINDVAWYVGNNSPNGTKPVGTLAPNGLDIYDMSGNVYEWCWDWWGSYSSDAQNNPTGPERAYSRVIRGGYWGNGDSYCRISARDDLAPSSSNRSTGFRWARSIPAASTPTFDPPAGTYTSIQNVVITCATEGAAVYYSTDGSEPDESSTLYSGAIEISSTTTLKARAYKSGWDASAIAEAEYVINLVPEGFVYVPGGTFTMGRTTGSGDGDELPTHSVTLNPFLMGKYEVTQAEYAQYMQPGSSWTSNYGLGDNYPAYFVSWYATLKYCNFRSLAEGLTPVYSIAGSTDPADWGSVPTTSDSTWDAAICNWSANGYRLPSEAEWEYAARGATNTPDYLYSGSDDVNAVAWYSDNNTPRGCKPVGTKAPNGLGLYDMSGNVYEWCWDWWDSSYYSSSPENNPTGPATGFYRVQRAGSWLSASNYCRVVNRAGFNHYGGSNIGGFRLCRSTP